MVCLSHPSVSHASRGMYENIVEDHHVNAGIWIAGYWRNYS